MERQACVEVPALPLQILLNRHPEWALLEVPIAVVQEDKPQSPLLWVNAEARRHHILAGMRYTAGLSLSGDLRAGPVPPEAIGECVAVLVEKLRRFTPHIEPSSREPGIFWLDASGLEGLFPSLDAWARLIQEDLDASGYSPIVVVGFSRFGTYAAARSLGALIDLPIRREPGAKDIERIRVFGDPDEERSNTNQVRLDRLNIDPGARDLLDRLGVTTVEELTRLPRAELPRRFGVELHDLHQWAMGQQQVSFRPLPPVEPIEEIVDLDFPETGWIALLFLVEQLLPGLLNRLERRGLHLDTLIVRRVLEGEHGEREDVLRLAAPTRDPHQILEIVRLRLSATPLPSGVATLAVTAHGSRVMGGNVSLFASRPRRDLESAEQALARIRAEFGNDAVVRARLQDGHLPEAQYAWERLEKLPPPAGRPVDPAPRFLVRRLLDRPRELPSSFVRDLRSFLDGGEGLVRLEGPHVLQGGWWSGHEIHRDYYFAETLRGHLLWIFYDHRRHRWFLHGSVE